MVTALVVQDGGTAGLIGNPLVLALVGVLALFFDTGIPTLLFANGKKPK